MDTNLINIYVFLYVIFIFSTTFYCYLGDRCCVKKRKYNIVSTHDEDDVYTQDINVYEDEIDNEIDNGNDSK